MNAYKIMLDFNERHKKHNVAETYKRMQQKRIYLKKNNNLPNQVFFPAIEITGISDFLLLKAMQGKLQQSVRFVELNSEQLEICEFLFGVHLFGSWRNTLGIYCIDKDIFDDVINSPIPDDTPTDIFLRLPEWSIYMEFPKQVLFDNRHLANGFWATYDYMEKNGKWCIALNIVFNFENSDSIGYNHFYPITLFLNEGISILDAFKSIFINSNPIELGVMVTTDYKMLTKILSCLLLLCVEKPDISKITGEAISKNELSSPKYQVNKKTGSFIVPNKPFIYQLGARLGGEIREKQESINTLNLDKSRTVRPHIRRGHWHGYWKGTRQNKHFDVRWQPAIFVGFNG